LSYKQIALIAELSNACLAKLVKKENLSTKDKNIKKIAKALKVKPEYFKEYHSHRLPETLVSSIDFYQDNYDISLSDR